MAIDVVETVDAKELSLADVVRTGPGTIAGRYMRRFWQPVALLDEVMPGRAKPIRVMGEDFTYYRGSSGTPHIVDFRCAHRGTQLSTGWVEGDCIRCFYHGWKYDATGQCVDQPNEPESFAHKVKIGGYPAQSYLGLVWAYLGEGEAPPFPHFDAFDDPGLIEAFAVTRKTNYFNQIENNHDQTHINFAHGRSQFTAAGINREVPSLGAEETDYGILKTATYSDGKVRVSHTLMPNGAITTVYDDDAGWMPHLTYRTPIDDEHNTSFTVDLIRLEGDDLRHYQEQKRSRDRLLEQLPPETEVVDKILRGEMHVDEVSERRPDIVYLQDTVALRAQPSLADRPPDRLGRADIQLILLRKIWLRELRALKYGDDVKRWTYPSDLVAVTGT
jgi:5,5'-dehydrodivanillate O-demethylase